MKKILTLCMTMILLLTLAPVSALAVETYTTSDEGVAFIKRFEGYREMPYQDARGNWFVGYGYACDPDDYPYGVSEAEAEWLLRQELEGKEERINRLLMDHDISVTQYQFDAMMSMTYTLGYQWINPTYRFCSYLINGIWDYSEVEIVNSIATWCHQGAQVLPQLANRRLQEAYLFLYGEYENSAPEDYTYIHFEPEGGAVENKTVFYPVGMPYGELPEPTWAGRRFVGWFDSAGVEYTGGEIAWDNVDLTARWDGETGGAVSKPDIDLSAWVNPYVDVKDSDWYYTYVRELSAKQVMEGYPDGTFRAESPLTAGAGLKMILLAAGYPVQEPATAHWASGYLTLAQQLGCVVPGEIQDLQEPISRRLVAKIAAIALGIEPSYSASPFADSDDGYLTALYEERILKGSVVGRDRLYYPENGIKRSEVCAIVSRIGSWEETEFNDPAQSGFIKYGKQYVPVLRDVPAAPYDTNLFVQDGSIMYYNDPAYETSIGIDVSSYQGNIDWEQVADAGIEFAMIRVGGRGYSEGAIYLDKTFQQNIVGAKAAGLKVGVYFYSQAISVEEAEEEACFVLDNLAEMGVPLDYPVVYDWEIAPSSTARTAGIDSETLTDCAIAFCETVAWEGYIPMVYYGTRVGYTMYDLSRLTDYDAWFPQYAQWPTMYYDYRIWQYTDSGKVPGIDGRTDMNIAFIPY